MIYRICYIMFITSFIFGIWLDDNFKESKVRTLMFVTICVGLIGQFLGIG